MDKIFKEDFEINELERYDFIVIMGPILDRKPRRPKRMVLNN